MEAIGTDTFILSASLLSRYVFIQVKINVEPFARTLVALYAARTGREIPSHVK